MLKTVFSMKAYLIKKTNKQTNKQNNKKPQLQQHS